MLVSRWMVALLRLRLRLFDVEVLKTLVIVCLFRDNEVVHQNTLLHSFIDSFIHLYFEFALSFHQTRTSRTSSSI